MKFVQVSWRGWQLNWTTSAEEVHMMRKIQYSNTGSSILTEKSEGLLVSFALTCVLQTFLLNAVCLIVKVKMRTVLSSWQLSKLLRKTTWCSWKLGKKNCMCTLRFCLVLVRQDGVKLTKEHFSYQNPLAHNWCLP